MKEKAISIISAVVGGTPMYYLVDNVILPIAVAFLCGLVGFWANKLGQKIDKRIKSKKDENNKN